MRWRHDCARHSPHLQRMWRTHIVPRISEYFGVYFGKPDSDSAEEDGPARAPAAAAAANATALDAYEELGSSQSVSSSAVSDKATIAPRALRAADDVDDEGPLLRSFTSPTQNPSPMQSTAHQMKVVVVVVVALHRYRSQCRLPPLCANRRCSAHFAPRSVANAARGPTTPASFDVRVVQTSATLVRDPHALFLWRLTLSWQFRCSTLLPHCRHPASRTPLPPFRAGSAAQDCFSCAS